MYILNRDINPGYIEVMHCCKVPRFAHRLLLLLWPIVVKKGRRAFFKDRVHARRSAGPVGRPELGLQAAPGSQLVVVGGLEEELGVGWCREEGQSSSGRSAPFLGWPSSKGQLSLGLLVLASKWSAPTPA